MVRMLIKSLLSLSLIAPLSAYALGLGDVHLHSALGERLQADIDLLSVTQAEAESITVSLATQETFDKVGLERPAILMFLKFEKIQDAAGNYAIAVTSREPINEPFLDFLVEVDWKSGRVLREYTLLLDPPSSYRESAPAVSTPTTAPATSASTPITPASSTTPATSESMTTGTEMMPSEASSTVSTAPMVPAAADMTATTMPSEGLVYGPVKANDTLWRIAEKLRPSKDVTIQQMMLALVKANPYAFFDNNINRLKRGYVLRIDDPSILGAMGKADAAREVARQTRAWQDYREGVAAKAKQRPAAASAVEATPGVAAATKTEPKLKLVAPEGKGIDSATPAGTAEGTTAGDVSEELMLAMESSAAQRKENETLKARLEALEGQLQDMEQIISLKDADLAALQQQLRKQGGETVLPSEPPAVSTEISPTGEEPAQVAKEELPGATPEPEEMPVVADTTMPAEVEAKPEVVQPVEVKPEAVKPVEAKPEVVKPVTRPKPVAPPPPPEPTLVDMLMENLMYVIGGVVVLLLLIMLAIVAKRRSKGSFQESILNGGTSSMMKASDEQGSETSFLSDLAISGMGGPGTIQTDEGEVDPLTEADVFMAYGRNQQAEEVLKKARASLPQRADIAAKLLEVYYSSKDRAKFEELVEETVGILQGDDALWSSVQAMGHELCPDNVLFEAGGAGTVAPVAAAAAAAAPAADAVMDIGLDLDELTAEMEGEGGGDSMDFDLGLDFSDLDDDESSDSDTATAETSETESSEFDLGDLGLGEAEPETAVQEGSDLDMDLGALDLDSGSEGTAEEAGGLDFDFDLGAGDEAAVAGSDDEMEFDLGELATDEPVATPAADMSFDLDMGAFTSDEDAGELDISLDMDTGDFDLGELESTAATETADSLDLDAALDDLGSLDELGDFDDLGDLDGGEDEMTTKLDLAQAYAEMGDAEGARSMLEEVVSAGNDEQKQQAQALIDKL